MPQEDYVPEVTVCIAACSDEAARTQSDPLFTAPFRDHEACRIFVLAGVTGSGASMEDDCKLKPDVHRVLVRDEDGEAIDAQRSVSNSVYGRVEGVATCQSLFDRLTDLVKENEADCEIIQDGVDAGGHRRSVFVRWNPVFLPVKNKPFKAALKVVLLIPEVDAVVLPKIGVQLSGLSARYGANVISYVVDTLKGLHLTADSVEIVCDSQSFNLPASKREPAKDGGDSADLREMMDQRVSPMGMAVDLVQRLMVGKARIRVPLRGESIRRLSQEVERVVAAIDPHNHSCGFCRQDIEGMDSLQLEAINLVCTIYWCPVMYFDEKDKVAFDDGVELAIMVDMMVNGDDISTVFPVIAIKPERAVVVGVHKRGMYGEAASASVSVDDAGSVHSPGSVDSGVLLEIGRC